MRIGRYHISLWSIIWRLLMLAAIVLVLISIFTHKPAVTATSPSETSPLPDITVASTPAPNLSLLVVQLDDTQGKRVLACNSSSCQPVTPPPDIKNDDMLFDGTWWYHYITKKNSQGKDITALIRTQSKNGEEEVIKEQTNLVEPREAVISPDGTKIAYWLDNIADDSGLTEVWVYDTEAGGSQVVAEKIVKKDVLTRLRWNHASTNLMFLANNGTDKEQKIEPVVIQVNPVATNVKFANVGAAGFTTEFQQGIVDIDTNGASLAIAKPVTSGTTQLTIVHDNTQPVSKIIGGGIVYTQWLPDGTLIYAVQAGTSVTFYKLQGTSEVPIAKTTGQFHSAEVIPGTTDIVFIAQAASLKAATLNIQTGTITPQTSLPSFGQYTYIAGAKPVPANSNSAVAGITTQLDDGEITAFIEKHTAEILQDDKAQPVRIVMTDHPNTAFIDYQVPTQPVKRILVIIKDAIHPEWKVLAHYESINGEWKQPTGEATDTNPTPTRLYEWESSQNQWILKQELGASN